MSALCLRRSLDTAEAMVRGGERAVRLLPPLNVTDEDITLALATLDASLSALETSEGGSQ